MGYLASVWKLQNCGGVKLYSRRLGKWIAVQIHIPV
jgi:hypothetical protein